MNYEHKWMANKTDLLNTNGEIMSYGRLGGIYL